MPIIVQKPKAQRPSQLQNSILMLPGTRGHPTRYKTSPYPELPAKTIPSPPSSPPKKPPVFPSQPPKDQPLTPASAIFLLTSLRVNSCPENTNGALAPPLLKPLPATSPEHPARQLRPVAPVNLEQSAVRRRGIAVDGEELRASCLRRGGG